MSNYPPGVTGNEPELTGEWPCVDCDGQGCDEDEDGKHSCPRCHGSGIEPEDYDLNYLEQLADEGAAPFRLEPVIGWARSCVWHRDDFVERAYLRALARLNRQLRGRD